MNASSDEPLLSSVCAVFVLQLRSPPRRPPTRRRRSLTKCATRRRATSISNVALGEGCVQGTSSVRGPDFGAMGVH
jgi:hypothetical protein